MTTEQPKFYCVVCKGETKPFPPDSVGRTFYRCSNGHTESKALTEKEFIRQLELAAEIMELESIPGCFCCSKPLTPNRCENCKVKDLCKQTIRKVLVVKCLPRLDFPGGMKFWCMYCQKWHLHGRNAGNRVPHCYFSSPLYGHDYEIKMMSKAELREIKKAIEEYLERQP